MSYILLVEDNQSNANMIIRILTAEGYQVKHTISGLAGAQLARQERPDLILMDYDLPDIDGRTIAVTLKRQLGGAGSPPIVAVTAQTNDIHMRMAGRLGFTAFIGKPFTPEDLLNVVTRVLRPTPPVENN